MDSALSREMLAGHVQQLLRHIDDHVYVRDHELASAFFPETAPGGADRGHRLRRLILEAIDKLNPPAGSPRRSVGWRGYHILTSHYLERREPREIMDELAISERQFYREQRRSIEALADLLWSDYLQIDGEPSGRPSTEVAGGVPPHTLQSEMERLYPKTEPVDLEELLCGILNTVVSPLIDERAVKVTYRFGQGLLPVRANRTLVRQVFIHLVGRLAIQAETRGLHIGVRGRGRQVQVEMAVLAPEGAPESTRETLDLDTAQSLVETIGGNWEGLSTSQHRYCIQFSLPTARPWILLAVDDNPSAARLLERYLAHQGYQIFAASNGDDALRLASELRPDVVTLDVMLPKQDGWEILRALKTNPSTRNVPVLVCSVLDECHVAQALGATGCLRKPFSQTQLLDKLSSMLPPSSSNVVESKALTSPRGHA